LRLLAAACGISNGAVDKYLKLRGLKVEGVPGKGGSKLVSVPVPQVNSPPPPPASDAGRSGPALTARAEDESSDTDEEGDEKESEPTAGDGNTEVSADGDPELSGARDTLATIQKELRSIGRGVDSLLRSKVVGDSLRRSASKRGLAFAVKEKERNADINDHAITRVEFWPVLADLQTLFADVLVELQQEDAT
jgi:hypothetical protein